jgi:hypothetical protein
VSSISRLEEGLSEGRQKSDAGRPPSDRINHSSTKLTAACAELFGNHGQKLKLYIKKSEDVTPGLVRLAQGHGVTHAAMDATGNFWMPVIVCSKGL